ncbi:AfsR/SARP family transcriptional regulator [Amycolatopsis magusensis]|uniref:Bacterial transcriptional activator domain-containing protein n=1 Tax=Amycolatopsis magusensis TaxID=882444 RepID=A0ABS4PTN7_9PSEU|nr:BTAD domain-containing putative transcriptional regulator [Amycolatopsis magusensis]MBP2182802.1 hypothetical protein [Amycolatopsis magusensis]
MTTAPGYLLDTGQAWVDLHDFRATVAQARQAFAEGRPADAARLADQALLLRQGPLLGGTMGEHMAAEATRLEELLIAAEELRADAHLAAGTGAGIVPGLMALVADHPLRENLRAQLMAALHQAGQAAAAMDVYRQGHTILSEQLGVSPGSRLRAGYAAVLRGAGGGERPAPPGRDRWQVGRQLPADIGDFVGRGAELAAVEVVLAHDRPGTAPSVCVVSGLAGIGKTALAIRAAHLGSARYPDGQLYADLGTATSAEVAARMLRATGVPSAEVPASAQERAALLRSRLAGRRVLLVLDNVRTPEQLSALLPGGPGCAVLATSRVQLTSVPGALHVTLGALPGGEAAEMLITVANRTVGEADREHAREVAELCGGMPLAIRAAAARLVSRPHWTVGVLAGWLRPESSRFDRLASAELDVRRSIARSVDGLPALTRFALRTLSGLRLTRIPASVVATAVGLEDADDVLESLVTNHLIDFVSRGSPGQAQYAIPDLVRLYAWEAAEREDSVEGRFGRPQAFPDGVPSHSSLWGTWRRCAFGSPHCTGRGVLSANPPHASSPPSAPA